MSFKNILLIPVALIWMSLIAHSIYRDIQLERFPADLRNRVVGARLQKDGRLPYFYYWTPEEGSRYFDPESCNQLKGSASRITASPFFHQLLFPICDFPQRTIAIIWGWLQYIMLAIMIWMFWRLSDGYPKKMLVLTAGIFFTTTEAWKSLILQGQLYFFVAFLIGCIIYSLHQNKKGFILFAGICAAAMVLTRPIALVIFLPFIFQYKKHLLFLATAFAACTLYGLFVLFSPPETALWKEYARAVQAHVQYHQGEIGVILRSCEPEDLEGINIAAVQKKIKEHPILVYSESGNVFYIYHLITGKKMSLVLLNILLVLTITLLVGFFSFFSGKNSLLLLQTLIFAFTLYMMVELFSPIYRHQYNTVQWFPIVLSGCLLTKEWKKPAFLLLALGLLLNIINTTWIPMRHTLGEIFWLAGLLLIVFTPINNRVPWKQPS
ncbi:MAG: glycosyltransferase 87 family protein [Chitinophagales bacterium]